MAVSKIAVIALVAVIAVPILIGYGMNLSESTYTDYKASDDSVNVTPLIFNGTDYSSTFGNTYQLNTNFEAQYYPIYPMYNTTNVSTKTSFPFRCGVDNNWNTETQNLTYCTEYIGTMTYNYSASSYITAKIYSGSTLISTLNHISYIHYVQSTDTIEYIVMTSVNGTYENSISGGNYTSIQYSPTGGQTATRHWAIQYNDNRAYTDISGGYYFSKSQLDHVAFWKIMLPNKTTSVLLSVDLNSITDSTYSVSIGGITLSKTTTGGNITWTANRLSDSVELYYDPNVSHNTYQILFEYPDNSRPSTDPTYPDPYREYERHVQFRYIGNWSQFIGEANYYQVYDINYWQYSIPDNNYINGLNLTNAYSRTPTVRVDSAQFLGLEYQVIENNTYQPSSFKTNPSTKLTNLQKSGTQIVFGGQTFNVNSNENTITLQSHDIPIDGLIFSSIPNDSGTYDNKIGNTLISTSAQPSTITFNGKWVISVATSSSEQFTYTTTEWNVGSFAWDGIDTNFLIVGLITCLGVFVALGIYARKSRSGGIIPLMIAVGCAAMVFFIML